MNPVKKLLVLFLSCLTVLSCCGCDFIDALMGKDISVSHDDAAEISGRFDVESVSEQIDALQKIWAQPDHEAEVQAAIDSLVKATDECYAVHVYAEAEYHADWNNAALSEREQITGHDYYEVFDMAEWTFANGYKKSQYEELFKPYVQMDSLDYYISTPLQRVRNAARSASATSSDFLDSYYDLAYSGSPDTAATNEECAKLYLEQLRQYDTSEYLYNYYHRDYTAEQASAMYKVIVKKLVPLYQQLTAYIQKNLRYAQFQTDLTLMKQDPFDILKTNAPKLSANIAASAFHLVDQKRYITGTGDNCYDGSYTVTVPSEQDAFMYIYLKGSFNDLFSVTHEFGHYHADWRDGTSVMQENNCIDLAEVQSQGMELLFTHCYPEIFGEYAKTAELLEIYNILDSIVSGFAVGEFEYEVMQHVKDYESPDVVKIFDRIHDSCDLGIEMYQILHLFEHPGYYISYGVSALAALQIYTQMQKSVPDAVAQYEKIAETSSLNGKNQLLHALEHAGFDSIFDEAALEQMIATVQERVQILK